MSEFVYPGIVDMQMALRAPDAQDMPPLQIAVARNITVDNLVPYLRYSALTCGLRADVRMGDFDTTAMEALSPRSALFDGADIILVFHTLRGAAPVLIDGYPAASKEEIRSAAEQYLDQAQAILEGIRRQSTALILWCGTESPAAPAMGLLDAVHPLGQRAILAEVSRRLAEQLWLVGDAHMIDLESLVRRVGDAAFYDPRMWHFARAPFATPGLEAIADTFGRALRALKGRSRKCLVLDCDNTLWGGIVGEDGIEGIKLGTAHPGSAYRAFQQQALNLFHRGVILALCSKNNEEDVWEVFERHPEMLLRREHIAAHRINWQDKSANIGALADELNIGLDSVVFVDDSPFEVELVRQSLPEIHVIHLPVEEAPRAADRLAGCGLFDTLSLTEEDRQRGQMYSENASRARNRKDSTDLASYLASLDIVVEVRHACPDRYGRIAQLTQKTNQFNLTTRRYGESDIARFAEAEGSDVLQCTVRDRFGVYGLVGVVVLRHESGDTEIDSLLMSCRVLGRGVEPTMLTAAARLAVAHGSRRLVGSYLPTRKNRMVERFYPENGFEPAGNASMECAVYAMDPRAYHPPPLDHITTHLLPERASSA